MDIVTIDFETYYDKDYSLSKITTEAYVRSPNFEVIGVGVKVNNHPTDWYSGDNPGRFLKSLDYRDKAILCHHTAFDGAILSWHFGIRPKLWLDTLSMARPLHNMTVGGSLKALATYYGLGEKGTEVVNAIGLRRADFTPEALSKYGEYCVNDVELTYNLFKKLSKGFPVSELMVIDQTIRMYTEPVIELDSDMLLSHLNEVKLGKKKLLDEMGLTGIADETITKTLMSNEIFAKYLRNLGIEPPTKVSARTGKVAYAFSKTDKEFTDLLEHPDERVQTAVAARLGVKSTIEETRTEALLGVAKRGRLPIMLNYYGAHTGRFSGGDKLNLQNLPARGNNSIRRALKAPAGHKIIACDSSQIEARMVAYVAGQEDLVHAFREGRDVYSEFASEVYGRKITKADKVERFVGKTCIAEGTLVLSDSGWKPIEQISLHDKLWDGEEWVCHQGLLNNGTKPTLNLCGIWLTPDHQVLSGTQWLESQLVAQDENILFRALGTGAANLPFQAMYEDKNSVSKPLLSNATVTELSTQSTTITSKISKVLDVLCAPKKQLLQNAIGCTAKQCQMISTGLAYSIASLQQSLGVIRLQTEHINITGSGESKYAACGAVIEPSSYATHKPLKGGITLILRWIESMLMGIMNREISASYREAITSKTNVESQISKPVYDILNCGSRNRFTILTEAGPLIVHNCILGLGYGMGAEKFRRTLEIGQGGISVKIDLSEADRIVRLYRQKNFKITQLWNLCGNALNGMIAGGSGLITPLVPYDNEGIILPNKLRIRYPALRKTESGFMYIADAREFRKAVEKRVMSGEVVEVNWTKIYGGKVTENLIQALARIVIAEQMAMIGQHYHVAFQVHDEIIITAPDDMAHHAEQLLIQIMSTPPVWASELPVACESGMADNYGDT